MNHLYLRSTCSHPTPFSSASSRSSAGILIALSLSFSLPCFSLAPFPSLSRSFSFSLYSPSRLFPLLSSRAPSRDNNYPFESLGTSKVTILLLAASPLCRLRLRLSIERYSRYIDYVSFFPALIRPDSYHRPTSARFISEAFN